MTSGSGRACCIFCCCCCWRRRRAAQPSRHVCQTNFLVTCQRSLSLGSRKIKSCARSGVISLDSLKCRASTDRHVRRDLVFVSRDQAATHQWLINAARRGPCGQACWVTWCPSVTRTRDCLYLQISLGYPFFFFSFFLSFQYFFLLCLHSTPRHWFKRFNKWRL